MTDTVSASEARDKLFPLIEKVNNDRTAIHITSKKGNAVLLSEDDFNAMQETLYLLRSPANAARLAQGIAQAESGGPGPALGYGRSTPPPQHNPASL